MNRKDAIFKRRMIFSYALLIAIYLVVGLFLVGFKLTVIKIPQTVYLIFIVGLSFLYAIIFLFMLFQYICRKDLTYVILLGIAFLSCDIYLIETINIVQSLINDGISIEKKTNDIAIFYYFRQLSFIILLSISIKSFKPVPTIIETNERNPWYVFIATVTMLFMAFIAHNLSSYNPDMAITITTLKDDRKTLHWEIYYIYSLIVFWGVILTYLTWKTRLRNPLWISIALTCCSAILINILLLTLDEYSLYIWYLSRGVETICALCVISILLYNFFIILKRETDSSIRDPLTKLYNRRLFYVASKTFPRGKNICLMIIDIDKFKRINDTYGHQEGDNVIVSIVDIVNKSIKTDDIFARLGGEEFAILCNCESKEDAIYFAETIRKNVETFTTLPSTYNLKEKMTISIGGYFGATEGKSIDKILSYADAALYEAKNSGRNKAVFYKG